jgi:phosphatidylserine/phosphatidylglycerophosphate/cardiolipin synthase-like enzyme
MFEKGSAVGSIQPYFLSQIDQKLSKKPIDKQTNQNAINAQASKTANLLADYISVAKYRLDIAIYDFRLPDGSVHDTVVNAINAAAQHGIAVRIAYDRDQDQKVPGTIDYFISAGADPAPDGTNEFVESKRRFDPRVARKGITTVGVDPQHHIMHQKYILRDARTPTASVLMGSTNFTLDAWAAQENNILVLDSVPDLVEMYENDFGEMWTSGKIGTTGVNDSGHFSLSGGTQVDVAFAPGEGSEVEGRIADVIAGASNRLYVASMVISSGKILRSILHAMTDVQEFGGIYDGGSMNGVKRQWARGKANRQAKKATKEKLDSFSSSEKLGMWTRLAPHLHVKDSFAYGDKIPHNFMHDKVAVADDTVVTGSFNFSNNAMKNAENILVIKNTALADQYAAYIKGLLKRYGAEDDKNASGT